jgi:hypothetical protein
MAMSRKGKFREERSSTAKTAKEEKLGGLLTNRSGKPLQPQSSLAKIQVWVGSEESLLALR